MENFYYISACPGAGKTTWMINEHGPLMMRLGMRVLVVVPSKVLANQIATDSRGQFRAVHSDTVPGDVCAAIQRIFESPDDVSGLVITEASFMLVSHRLSGKEKWVVFKDEANEPLHIETVSCPDSRSMLREWMTFEPVESPGCRTIHKAVSFTEACPETSTIDDGITGALHQLKSLVRNPCVEVLVDDSRLEWATPQLSYSVFVLPTLYEGFHSAFFFGANFEHTFLYHQWKALGVKWVDKSPTSLRVSLKSERVRLHYWSENGSWSRSRRHRPGELARYVGWVKSQLSDDDYIYSVNKDDATLPEVRSLTGQAIPAVCHGLNKWRHITRFVLLSSYLVSNHEEPFFRRYGTSTSDSRMMRNAQMIFQQLTRSSLRNRDDEAVIDVFLPTLTEVRELLPYLPKATVVDVYKRGDGIKTGYDAVLSSDWLMRTDTEQEVPIRGLTPSYALGARTKSRTAFCVPNNWRDDVALPVGGLVLMNDEPDELMDENEGGNVLLGGMFSSNKSGTKSGRGAPRKSIHPALELITGLADVSIKGLSDDQAKDIKRNHLPFFTTGLFADGASFTKANLLGNNDIIAFDFDGSDLSVRDLGCIFRGLELMRYTTISDRPGALRRFRVVLPCSRVMSLAEHRTLMNYWRGKIDAYAREHGRVGGLDHHCLSPERKFYLPHKESEITHLRKDKKVMNVDAVLSLVPRAAIIPVPTINDLRVIGKQADGRHNSVMDRVEAVIGSMGKGDRSTKACQVGGLLGRYAHPSEHEAVFARMRSVGVGSEALKSARHYASEGRWYR
jgi:hypothetical protein